MILEGLAIISVGTYVYKKINEKEIKEKKLKNEIKNKWNILMEGIGSQAENKIKQEYEMLKIIPCKYGFKAIISLPFGRTTADLRKLIPKISAVYRANVIIEPSNNSAFMRVWIKGNEIDNSELTKFKWYSYFDSDKFRNKNGETFKLSKIKDITNPMDKEDVLGTLFDVNIPSGLNYKDLKAEELDLSRKFGICEIDYDMIKKVTTCQIIDNRIDDKVEYKPIKVNPWELFIGMQHNWTPIILDNSKLANTLVSGRVGSGKTVAIIIGILN